MIKARQGGIDVVKKWVDIDNIFTTDLEEKDIKFKRLMEEVLNFDKRVGVSKVYEKEGYIILKMKKGFIAYNTKKEFSEGHSHLHSFQMSKTIIDNCIRKKKPKTDSLYLLDSHIRLSNDVNYKIFIKEIITSKKGNKKVKYINVNSRG